MKLTNVNPEIEATLEAHIGFHVNLTVRSGVLFNWSGELARSSAGPGLYQLLHVGGPEIVFELARVDKIYVDPAKTLSIYVA